MFSSTRRVCVGDVAVDHLRRSPDRSAPARRRTAAGRPGGPASRARSPSARPGLRNRLLHAALTTLLERRQRVQTRIRLTPPLIMRADRLQVRLEPPRAHVVRVADLPADDRRLPADFTTLGHVLPPCQETSSIMPTRSGDRSSVSWLSVRRSYRVTADWRPASVRVLGRASSRAESNVQQAASDSSRSRLRATRRCLDAGAVRQPRRARTPIRRRCPASASNGLQRGHQARGRQRRGLVLVDDPAAAVSSVDAQRPAASRDVVVDERLQFRRLVADDERLGDQEEELRLALVEVPQQSTSSIATVVLLLAHERRRADARGRWRDTGSRTDRRFRPAAWCRSRRRRSAGRAPDRPVGAAVDGRADTASAPQCSDVASSPRVHDNFAHPVSTLCGICNCRRRQCVTRRRFSTARRLRKRTDCHPRRRNSAW